jgi:hypothetical protein
MKRFALALVLASATLALAVHAEPPHAAPAAAAAPPRFEGALEARRVKMVGALKPGMRAKLDGPIQDVLRRAQPAAAAPGKPAAPAADLMAVARTSLGSLAGVEGDIEALCFIVLMEAAKSAQEDLKAVMAEVQAINAKKAALRAAQAALNAAKASAKPCPTLDCISAIPASSDFAKADVDAVKQTLTAVPDARRLDKLGEMSEQQQIRMQIYMDRRAKALETLSNIMKKISDTQSTIAGNMK